MAIIENLRHYPQIRSPDKEPKAVWPPPPTRPGKGRAVGRGRGSWGGRKGERGPLGAASHNPWRANWNADSVLLKPLPGQITSQFPRFPCLEKQWGVATLENSFATSYKLMVLLLCGRNSTPTHLTKRNENTCSHTHTKKPYMSTFMAVLFLVAQSGKNPNAY